MNNLGYHVIIWDLDTDDYNNVSPQKIQNSKNNVLAAVRGSDPRVTSFMSISSVDQSFLEIEKRLKANTGEGRHDVHQQTVTNLTSFQIDVGRANGYRRMYQNSATLETGLELISRTYRC